MTRTNKSTATPAGYTKLWSLMDIRDEAVVDQLETSLRRLGCFHPDDLVFVDANDAIQSFPKTTLLSRVQIAKFQAICKYHHMGFSLKSSLTMKEIMRVVNPPSQERSSSGAASPASETSSTWSTASPRSSIQTVSTTNPRDKRPPFVKRQVSPTSVATASLSEDEILAETPSAPKRLLNIVLIGDSEPGTPGWLHLNQFREDEELQEMGVHVHTIVQPKTDNEAYIQFCREQKIQLLSHVEELTIEASDGQHICKVPSPYLFLLLTSRIHNLFKLLQHTDPAAILMDIPGTMTAKSLQTLEECVRERNIPTYLGGVAGSMSRTIAPYIQGTLDVASTYGMDPLVTLSVEQGCPTLVNGQQQQQHNVYHKQRQHLETLLAQGSIFKTCCFPELVMAVMYFGIKVEALCRFRVNPALTERVQSVAGRSDYSKVAFQMTTESGIQLSILANRCGTMDAHLGSVSDAEGKVVRQFDHVHKHCDKLLKKRLVRSIRMAENDEDGDNSTTKEVLPTIRVGVEALRLAEEVLKHMDKAMGDGLSSKPAEDQPSPPRRRGLLRWISSRTSGGA